MIIPIHIDEFGNSMDTRVLIENNNTDFPIVLVAADIVPLGEWELTTSDEIRRTCIGDSKKFSLSLLGNDVTDYGRVSLGDSEELIIGAESSLYIDYDIRIAAQRNAIMLSEQLVQVTFIIDWYNYDYYYSRYMAEIAPPMQYNQTSKWPN